MSEHRRPAHSTHHDLDWDSPTMAARTELEGEVLAGLVERALAVLGDLCAAGSLNVSHILDLGCGPGVSTCLLAECFGSATILAVDGSAEMLDRAAARARRLALEQRVQTRLVELPAGLDSLDQADVVWASMVLHHVGDEVAALRQVRRLLTPGGLLAVVEHGGELRVLPADTDLGRPGLWERLEVAAKAWFADMRADLSETTKSGSYADMLRLAGFRVSPTSCSPSHSSPHSTIAPVASPTSTFCGPALSWGLTPIPRTSKHSTCSSTGEPARASCGDTTRS